MNNPNDDSTNTSFGESSSSSKKSSSRSSSAGASSRRLKSATAANDGNIETMLLNGGGASNTTNTTNTVNTIVEHPPTDVVAKVKKREKKQRAAAVVEATDDNNNNNNNGSSTTATAATADTAKRVKKKKSKQREKQRRRSSAEEESSDKEVSPESSRSSSSGASASGGSRIMEGGKLRDSLTLMASAAANATKELKSIGKGNQNNNNQNQIMRQPTSPKRLTAVQFTASTLQRDSTKKLLGQVMGEEESDDDDNNNNDASGVGEKGSTRSIGGSALKKQSKYSSGGGSGGGRVPSKKSMFAMTSGNDVNNNEDDETKDATNSKSRRNSYDMFKIPSSFEIQDNDDHDDTTPDSSTKNNINNSITPKEQRRSSRKQMFARVAQNSSLRNSNNSIISSNNTSALSFRETRRATAPPLKLRRGQADSSSEEEEEDDDNQEGSPKKSSRRSLPPPPPPRRANSFNELNQRPAISRRHSLKSINNLMMMDDNKDDEQNDEDDTTNITTLLAQKVNAVKSLTTGQQKEMRRVRMSMEKQIFIPPKNRNKGIFTAFSHLLAGRVAEYVMWTYKAAFGKVMLMFLTFYVVNIFMWAGIMDAVDRSTGGMCIHDESFDPTAFTSLQRYEFAFELSWTTFTTVGYGAIGPAPDVPNCYPIRLVCAFVAFTGVLFGSTTAAIMYSKLMRLLARAHVTFSSTLCVQFGRGHEGSTVRFGQFNFRASVAPAVLKSLSMEDLEMDDSEDENKREDPLSTSEEGFPVIEFRMVNDRANHEGSEIWDAQIRGIIQLKKDVNPSNAPNAKATGGESTLDLDKKAYYQFALTPDSHPHFSRIWYARHVLNAESPLLKREIRDEIMQESGKWDKDYNTASEIRKCLNEFISLRITLSGTSAVSANTVFAEHVYEYEDVVVGWRFANMVYEKEPKSRLWRRFFPFGRGAGDATEFKDNSDTHTKVDIALIHDIVPQPGDDYENLAEVSTLAQLSGLFQR